MANAVQPFEQFTLDDGQKRIEVVEDTKIPNAATIRVNKEDHTLANIIRGYLLKNPKVLFAGYKAPHPLNPYFMLKIQTDGSATPVEVLEETCQTLIRLLSALERQFKDQFAARELDIAVPDDPYVNPGAAPSLPYGAEPRRRAADYMDFS